MSFRRRPQTPEALEKARARKRARERRKALAKVRNLAADGEDADLSAWESDFLDSLDERLERYDAAFRSRDLGPADAALSNLQKQKLKEIDAKRRKALRDERATPQDAAPDDAPAADDPAPAETPRLRLVRPDD